MDDNRERHEYYFGNGNSEEGVIKEQDRLLPIANVGRIIKQILPPNAKISKEAKDPMQECVSEFISFVTGEASDKCHKEKRKTVNGDDVCWAMGSLGFDDYAHSLKRYLQRFREFESENAISQNRMGHVDYDHQYQQPSTDNTYELPPMSDNKLNVSIPAGMNTFKFGPRDEQLLKPLQSKKIMKFLLLHIMGWE